MAGTPFFVKMFLGAHVAVYGMSGGKVGGKMGPNASLLLTTTGRKSKQPRTLPLGYFRDGEDFVVTASNGGQPRFYEREMTAYCLLRGIEYIYEECPYAEGAQSIYYKELLNQLETTRPGAKLTFYLRFLEARKRGDLFIEQNAGRALLHACPKCGQPPSTADLCYFCRMMEKANPVPTG